VSDPTITFPRAPSSPEYTEFISSFLYRKEKPEGYHELHHIISRCLGGSDDTSNLVWLTPIEHLQAHKLLIDAFPEEVKLKQAYWFMSHLDGRELSPQEYLDLRTKCLDGLKTNLGKNFSEEWRKNIGKAHKNKTISEEHKKLNSKFMKALMENDPTARENSRKGGLATGKMLWWHKEDQVTRSHSCPGDGWERGRGPQGKYFAAKGGKMSKGKTRWYRIAEDGIVERTRSKECPGDGWIKGVFKG